MSETKKNPKRLKLMPYETSDELVAPIPQTIEPVPNYIYYGIGGIFIGYIIYKRVTTVLEEPKVVPQVEAKPTPQPKPKRKF